MEKVKEYSNGEVTIIWKPEQCIHSGICVKGLPEVFQPKDKPWIKIDNATTQALVSQVKDCPSGALSHYMNSEKEQMEQPEDIKVEIRENGPLLVYGDCEIKNPDGSTTTKKRSSAFCRCGASSNKPFCDGSHADVGFVG
ncbi:(4Fe-4S)-binding protein [Winogradskyella maritima]|uniref:(4Fe-4S)-binding protein n=1 Tax=Winogradskyella maritima TaxID=1517766 RepID=A0ABV8AFV0_9FLAO|nr:(4Fe-4S)-binding protein [Winogradskyella maritima]